MRENGRLEQQNVPHVGFGDAITILFHLQYYESEAYREQKKELNTYAFLSWNRALPCHQVQCTVGVLHWSCNETLKKRSARKAGKIGTKLCEYRQWRLTNG
jgi:hypothetical protein